MAETKITCLRCHSDMDIGYVLDRAHNTSEVANWVGGAPDRRWYGLTTKGHVNVPLVAYRCRACGYVELRAPRQTDE
jgi:hypothetical protein